MVSHSFPYLGIAAKYRLDYGDVLQIADASMKRGTLGCPALKRVNKQMVADRAPTIGQRSALNLYWKFIDDLMLAEIHMMQYRAGERDYITGEIVGSPASRAMHVVEKIDALTSRPITSRELIAKLDTPEIRAAIVDRGNRHA